MAQGEALMNEVARLVNIEFFQHGQPLTGTLLTQLILLVNEMLTEEDPSA